MFISCGSSKTTSVKNKSPIAQDLSNIEYAGGDGTTMDTAIIILNATNGFQGISAEYAYLGKKYGKRGSDWIFLKQALLYEKDKKYDLLTFKIPPSNDEINIYFDITNFFGKY